MKQKLIALLAFSFASLSLSVAAQAQIGPDLRPPGLSPDHPVDSYSEKGKNNGDDWRHEAGWELNASDIVFSAAKKRQLLSEAPSTIHIITDKDIRAHGWRSLAEVLRHVPGVQMLHTKSGFQSVMIRGLVGTEDNNSRILWLQNGVPMNDVRDAGIWLDETYPVELIKRIEIVLGPGSALYGSGAFQGVVNIFTKDPGDIDKYGEYRLTLQENMTFKASAIAAHTFENGIGILGHVSGNTTQGSGLIADYVYNNYAMWQASENISSNGAAQGMRAETVDSNSDKHWYSINFKLNYENLKWNVGFTDIYAGADGNEVVPNIDYNTLDYNSDLLGSTVSRSELEAYNRAHGIDSLKYSDFGRYQYRFDRREFYTDLIYENNFTDDTTFLALLSYRMNYYQNRHYRNYIDDKEVGEWYCNKNDNCAFGTYGEKKVDFETMQHKLYGLAQIQWRIYEQNELIAGAVFEYQHIHSDDFMNGSGIPDNVTADGVNKNIDATTLGQLTPSLFVQDEQRFWSDRIILTAGLRFDAYRVYMSGDKDPDYAPSWRFAFLAKWTDWMNMRVSYGYSFKEPSLYQLYVDTFDVVGNSELKPETLHNIELSFLFTPFYFMKIRFDAFASIMDNLIIMSFAENKGMANLGEDGRYTPTQKSGEGANILGFELGFDTAIGTNWDIYAHYNFLYSMRTYKTDDDIGDSDLVPDDAMHRLKIGATYRNDFLTADLAAFLVGGTPRTASQTGWGSRDTYKTPVYAILQPHVAVNVGADIGLSVGGSFAFSEGFESAPTHKYYYEKEGTPVNRYSVMFTAFYPYK